MTPPSETLIDYAHGAVEIIRCSLDLYHKGVRPAYRVIAAQLRLLLCDTNRIHNKLLDVSLLPRVEAEVRLPPLRRDAREIEFDLESEPIPLEKWLRQPVPAYASLRLRELIRTVSEQDGGAHVDLKPDSPLWGYEQRAEAVVRIGEMVGELEF